MECSVPAVWVIYVGGGYSCRTYKVTPVTGATAAILETLIMWPCMLPYFNASFRPVIIFCAKKVPWLAKRTIQ